MQEKKHLITMYHFIDNGNYYLMHKDFKQALEVGAKLKVKQEADGIEIYGFKSLIGIIYKVEDCVFPDNVELQIKDVEEPIRVYSVMEDFMLLISQSDLEKAYEKGSTIDIDNINKYKIPIVNDDDYYEIISHDFPKYTDVRTKSISKWYLEKRKVK